MGGKGDSTDCCLSDLRMTTMAMIIVITGDGYDRADAAPDEACWYSGRKPGFSFNSYLKLSNHGASVLGSGALSDSTDFRLNRVGS